MFNIKKVYKSRGLYKSILLKKKVVIYSLRVLR